MNFKTYLEGTDDSHGLTEQDREDIRDMQEKMIKLGDAFEKLGAQPAINKKHISFELDLNDQLIGWMIIKEDILTIDDYVENIYALAPRIIDDVMDGLFTFDSKSKQISSLNDSKSKWIKVRAHYSTPAITSKWRAILRKLAQQHAGYSKLEYSTKI